jgi:hypothetical protein
MCDYDGEHLSRCPVLYKDQPRPSRS